jgi:hypothetical protein
VKKLLLLCVASTLLVALNACSAGSASSNQTVLAQTTYSNASLTGTYSAVWTNVGSQESGNLNAFYSGVGTLQFSGTGNISSGTLSFYTEANAVPGSAVPCVYNVTGTYSLLSTALGTASLSLSSTSSGCTATASWHIALAGADGGAVIQMARTDGAVASGSAVKQ